uniref:Uncharacterized protein n=1 Tax=Rhizophora mucronata TaxID=61149 RepID=A0A2P2NH73_RHIMU
MGLPLFPSVSHITLFDKLV